MSTKAAKIQEIVRNWGVHKKFKTLAAIPSLHPAQDCIYYSNKLTVSASCPAKREKGSDSMKIERISENQLKLTLTKADLAEIKIKPNILHKVPQMVLTVSDKDTIMQL